MPRRDLPYSSSPGRRATTSMAAAYARFDHGGSSLVGGSSQSARPRHPWLPEMRSWSPGRQHRRLPAGSTSRRSRRTTRWRRECRAGTCRTHPPPGGERRPRSQRRMHALTTAEALWWEVPAKVLDLVTLGCQKCGAGLRVDSIDGFQRDPHLVVRAVQPAGVENAAPGLAVLILPREESDDLDRSGVCTL